MLAVLWDFIDGLPTYIAAFYQDNLSIEDWGRIVQPRVGGGRTTSVSIMNARGVKKMCENWIAVLNDDAYIKLLARKKWIGYNLLTERKEHKDAVCLDKSDTPQD